jgi:putative ABC transport system permease protein
MVRTALNLKVLRSLWILRFQTLSIAVLVACGSGLLIAAWSSYDALQRAKQSTYETLFFGDAFAEVKEAPLSLESRIRSIRGVREVDLRLVESALIRLPGAPSAQFISLPEHDQPGLDRVHLKSGRLPAPSLIPEVLLHEGFALARGLNPGDTLSAVVGGRQWKLRISGVALSPDSVYVIGPGSPLPDNSRYGLAWMNRKDLERITGKGRTFKRVSLKLSSNTPPLTVLEDLDRILRPYGSPGSYLRKDQYSNRLVENEITEQKTLAVLFPVIFLGIATLLIHSTLGRLVQLERIQIATLRALGYRSIEIMIHYLKLACCMIGGGAILGIALGTGIGQLLSRSYQAFFRFPEIRFSPGGDAILLGLLASVFSGVIGAISAMASIRSLTPAEALRPPAPRRFHSSYLDRSFLGPRIPVRVRMVLRNTLSRPLRLVWNTVGISCAWILLIMSWSWNDILENLIDERFQRLARETLSMSLRTPVKDASIQSWKRLPGVIEFETYRILPVRMRYAHHSKTLVLSGGPTSPRLELPTLDTPIHGLTDGLVLSRYFRNTWGLKVGDRMEFESLEEGQRSFIIPVSRFIQDPIGVSARLPKDLLHSQLNEAPSFNRILLRVDPAFVDQIHDRLEDSPLGTSIRTKADTLASFSRTLGTLIRGSTLVLVSFAIAMALAILLNSIRISFAEREKEIASLRVLGLPFSTAFDLLLSETAIQWILAAPIGCVAGNVLTRAALKAMHAEEYDFTAVISNRTYALSFLILGFCLAAGTQWMRIICRSKPLPDAVKSEE